MNRFFEFFIFAVILKCIHCIEYKDCGSTSGKVTSISVSGCEPTSTVCPLKTGTNATIEVKFLSETNSNTATVKIWGIIGGVPLPFNLKPSDACGNWNINCPIANGSANDLKITMPILQVYPKINVDIRVALIDSAGNKMLCQQFTAQIE